MATVHNLPSPTFLLLARHPPHHFLLSPLPQNQSLHFPTKPFLSSSTPSVSLSKAKPQHLSFSASNAQFLKSNQICLSIQQTQQCNFPSDRLNVSFPSDDFEVLYHKCLELLGLSVYYSDIEPAKAVHASILKFEADNYLLNALITAYLKLGLLSDAYTIFSGMCDPDVVTYTSIISVFGKSGYEFQALELFFSMRESGIEPNEFSFVALLTACGRMLELELGFQVHSLARKLGYLSSTFVANALMALCDKCGYLEDALVLFDEMPERDIASWNTVIAGVVNELMYDKAFELFRDMQRVDGFRVDQFALSSVLNACAGCSALKAGREIHARVLKMGFENNLSVNNALIAFYTKCGGLKNVEALFHRMPVKDVFTWTSMITAFMEFGVVDMAMEMFARMPERNSVSYNAVLAGLCRNGEGLKTLIMFCRMMVQGLELTDFTLTSVITSCSLLSEKKLSEQIHGFVLKFGFGTNACIEAALLDMCTRCGRMSDAQKMFNQKQPYLNSTFHWTSLMCGYARNGQPEEALHIFHLGQLEGKMVIDEVALTAMLGICGTLGFQEMGEQIHCHAIKCGFLDDLGVGNAVISMYSECGNMEDANKAFAIMPVHDMVSWNSLIAGYLLHRQGDDALAVWSKLEKASINLNSITFLLIISSYKHTKSNLVDDCRRLFLSMKTVYNIEPTTKHYASFVSVLGYWGFLEEAEDTIAKMPFDPEANVWRSLLKSCRIDLNSAMGKRTVKRILAIEPQDPSTFILVSNIYAASGRWHCSDMIREEMRRKGFRKHPVRSWIIHQNMVHTFYSRDKSHFQSKDIYSGVEILTLECLKAGYIPNTSFVLHEVEEHQKDFLFHHSAKLAVTYGLLMTTAGSPIRVSKNISLCGDCHNFFKYVSIVTKRDISLRDTSGFHFLSNGRCSCKDHW
ncbi:hypothetical protein Ancab_031757 [Ancistrocladus abbreviatus]